jgi:hypothetical protein
MRACQPLPHTPGRDQDTGPGGAAGANGRLLPAAMEAFAATRPTRPDEREQDGDPADREQDVPDRLRARPGRRAHRPGEDRSVGDRDRADSDAHFSPILGAATSSIESTNCKNATPP